MATGWSQIRGGGVGGNRDEKNGPMAGLVSQESNSQPNVHSIPAAARKDVSSPLSQVSKWP